MDRRLILIAPLFACAGALAQQPAPILPAPIPPVQEAAPLDPRKNQKVELIHHEDSGAVIDEVRYAGQTQSITVQPRADVPEYEITGTDIARKRPGDHRDGLSSANGQRVWNVFKF